MILIKEEEWFDWFSANVQLTLSRTAGELCGNSHVVVIQWDRNARDQNKLMKKECLLIYGGKDTNLNFFRY